MLNVKKLIYRAHRFRKRKREEHYQTVRDIITHPVTQEMKKYRHHCATSCFQHCMNISYYNYVICKLLGKDYISAARAGMLHDLFLYDWRTHAKQTGNHLHACTHPGRAAKNAGKYFDLSKKELGMIREHMWPVTVFDPPRSVESFVMTLTDKYCGLCEFVTYYSNIAFPKRPFSGK